MKLHFIDTETTGVTDEDEVIDLCILTWIDGVRDVRFNGAFWPRGEVSPGVAKVNGYSPEAWSMKERPPEFFSAGHCRQIATELDGIEFVVGSNPEFDVRMLRAMFARCRVPFPERYFRRVDLASLAFPLFAMGQIPGTGLAKLAEFYGLPPQPHTAKGDVLLGVEVFERLLSHSIDGFARPLAVS